MLTRPHAGFTPVDRWCDNYFPHSVKVRTRVRGVGSFQTEAPPTQGRAGAQSHLAATEKLRHVIIGALAPNAEFTIKDVGKDELGKQDLPKSATAPLLDVSLSR